MTEYLRDDAELVTDRRKDLDQHEPEWLAKTRKMLAEVDDEEEEGLDGAWGEWEDGDWAADYGVGWDAEDVEEDMDDMGLGDDDEEGPPTKKRRATSSKQKSAPAKASAAKKPQGGPSLADQDVFGDYDKAFGVVDDAFLPPTEDKNPLLKKAPNHSLSWKKRTELLKTARVALRSRGATHDCKYQMAVERLFLAVLSHTIARPSSSVGWRWLLDLLLSYWKYLYPFLKKVAQKKRGAGDFGAPANGLDPAVKVDHDGPQPEDHDEDRSDSIQDLFSFLELVENPEEAVWSLSSTLSGLDVAHLLKLCRHFPEIEKAEIEEATACTKLILFGIFGSQKGKDHARYSDEVPSWDDFFVSFAEVGAQTEVDEKSPLKSPRPTSALQEVFDKRRWPLAAKDFKERILPKLGQISADLWDGEFTTEPAPEPVVHVEVDQRAVAEDDFFGPLIGAGPVERKPKAAAASKSKPKSTAKTKTTIGKIPTGATSSNKLKLDDDDLGLDEEEDDISDAALEKLFAGTPADGEQDDLRLASESEQIVSEEESVDIRDGDKTLRGEQRKRKYPVRRHMASVGAGLPQATGDEDPPVRKKPGPKKKTEEEARIAKARKVFKELERARKKGAEEAGKEYTVREWQDEYADLSDGGKGPALPTRPDGGKREAVKAEKSMKKSAEQGRIAKARQAFKALENSRKRRAEEAG